MLKIGGMSENPARSTRRDVPQLHLILVSDSKVLAVRSELGMRIVLDRAHVWLDSYAPSRCGKLLSSRLALNSGAC
jgi:hypothetical protein